jgi:O-antigen/teichoic acid export membrane protein
MELLGFGSTPMNNKLFLKQSSIVFLGTLCGSGLGLIAMLLAPRWMGATAFGTFSGASAFLFLVIEMSELGINAGLVRFLSPSIQQSNYTESKKIITATALFRAGITFIAAILGFIFLPWIETLLNLQGNRTLLIVALLAIIPITVLSTLTAILQSCERFVSYSITTSINGLLKLILVVCFFATQMLTPATLILTIAVAALIAALFGVTQIPHQLRSLLKPGRSNFEQIIRFSTWMTIWALAIALVSRVDIFIIQRQLGTTSTGIYAAAYQFAYILSMIATTFSFVLNPKISGKSLEELRDYYRKYPLFIILFLGITLLVLLFGVIGLPWFYSNEYQGIGPLFAVLCIGMYFFGLTIMPNSVLFARNKPQFFALEALVQLLVKIVLNILLAPTYGILGVAWAFVGASFSSVVVNHLLVKKLLKE